MAAEQGNCCTCCLSSAITLGLTALFLWLSLRTDEPKCYIDFFYVPSLNKTSHSNNNNNNTIVFMLKLENGNKDKGIQYDAVQVAVGIFVDANTTRPVGNATVQGFYQGHQKKAKKWGSVEASGGLNRTAVPGKVVFRVDFTTAVKYKIMLWYKKRHRLWGGANVEVNVTTGEKVKRKGIRLGGGVPVRVESGAPMVRGRYRALLVLLVSVLTLIEFT